jgi:hypothetical protein
MAIALYRCQLTLLDVLPNLFGTNFKFRTRTEETNIKLKEEISLPQD